MLRFTTSALFFTIAAASAACSGSSSTDGTGGGSPNTGTNVLELEPCEPTLASIQATVFTPTCARVGCHGGATPEEELDLETAGVEARLVGVASKCGKPLVTKGSPVDSVLYEKISAETPTCGDRMPLGAALPATHIACIEDWITSLATGCETCGGDACVELATDAANCGACGNACSTGAACVNGACACPDGLVACDGACTDVTKNVAHCGACGQVCAGGELCAAGACAATCAAPQVACGTTCVDASTDEANCGACGQACGANEICVDSKCACPGGPDTQTDPNHCGGCGNRCAPGQSCVAGACTCADASVSFADAVQPILTASCVSSKCHDSTQPPAGLDLSIGKAYGEMVGVAASQCKDGRLRVKPGEPDESYVIDKILGVDMCSGAKMPKGTKTITDPSTKTLADWICAGAPNN